MNKYLFILGLVGTALFSACSSDDLMTALSPEEERVLVVEAGMDSDIPITLGSVGGRSSGMTRTPIVSTDNLFETQDGYLGVFCMAMGKQEDAPTIKNVIPASGDDIHWNTHIYSKWMDNVPAKVTTDGSTSAVTFLDPDNMPNEKECYYPFGNWYYYDFFAYYPKQNDANVATGWSYVDVNMTIDGRQDIIWGKASGEGLSVSDAGKTVKAFSAKYFRLAGTGTVPSFAYEHKLAQLVFYVKAHDDAVANTLNTNGYEVKDLKVADVYDQLLLTVASKVSSITAGTLTIKPGSSHVTDITVRNAADDSSPFPKVIANTASDTGEKLIGYAMVPPSALITSKTYNQYKVKLKVEDGSSHSYYDPAAANVDENGYRIIELTGTFLAGHKYEIVLEIY